MLDGKKLPECWSVLFQFYIQRMDILATDDDSFQNRAIGRTIFLSQVWGSVVLLFTVFSEPSMCMRP